MDINLTARRFDEVAAGFDVLCEQTGITDAELAISAGCAAPTIGRIRKGISEPGAVLFTKAVLRLGKTPNDLLLRKPADVQLDDEQFNEDERADLSRMMETFKSLKRLSTSPVSPVKMFSEALAAIEVTMREGAEEMKVMVREHSDGVKTLEPFVPPTKAERTRKGDSGKSDRLKPIERVGEDASDYGESVE